MEPFVAQRLSGWGRFPVEECHVFRPEKRRSAASILESGSQSNYIARGLGRSYGDAGLNGGGGVIDFTRLNRMLSFNPDTGVLECEAGVSLAEILSTFVPRGFFLSVLPGTKFITVGGAIANDVHGKNHHLDGTFSRFVESFELMKADGEVLRCSPEENSEAFHATTGGIGLTGVILSARVRLQKVESAFVSVDYRRVKNIDEALQAMTESDAGYKYSVAWVDCLARGASLGRSVLMWGNHASRDALAGRDPFRIPRKMKKSIPFDFPGFVLNPLSIRAFNEVFYQAHSSVQGKIIDYDSYFCPLDSIHNWNRMYGKRGFGQYQVTFPFSNSRGLIEMLERISRSRMASFLAVLKRMGSSGPGMLSYPSDGYTITLDIPMRRDLVPLLHEFDRHVLDNGGRLYCAKDAVAEPDTFATMYPRLDEYRRVKAALDPDCRFSSSMGRRLGIVPTGQGGVSNER
jgi:FAD/FMN-containing dehydrogenase